ncbi:conserved hypothetical protein [Ricinus communis]|uniref:Uncharacterized protein n=1 Tax=Ricinus communis TaxID=3988 RepID=B9REJ7_RICCO|nr:conserved hypothetical protein [Ricinus communis]
MRISTMLSRLELNAKTAWSVRDQAMVKLQWNVKFQDSDPLATKITYMAVMPGLVLKKVGIGSVAGNDSKREPENSHDVVEGCLAGKKKLDLGWQESDFLRSGRKI